ncbi:MAG: PHP domain-containing protein, partial [Candidatus Omnitrophica bacterium]|nr:PHP domain-containing protein [Candidatus Omnitrophota bacterium]
MVFGKSATGKFKNFVYSLITKLFDDLILKQPGCQVIFSKSRNCFESIGAGVSRKKIKKAFDESFSLGNSGEIIFNSNDFASSVLSNRGSSSIKKEVNGPEAVVSSPVTNEDGTVSMRGTLSRYIPAFRDELARKIGSGQLVLSVGCGRNGALERKLKAAGNTVLGLDTREEAKDNLQIEVVIGDAICMSTLLGCHLFDVVVFAESIGFMPDIPGVLQETKKVLKDAGKLIIAHRIWKGFISYDELVKLISQAGFSIVKREVSFWFSDWPYVIRNGQAMVVCAVLTRNDCSSSPIGEGPLVSRRARELCERCFTLFKLYQIQKSASSAITTNEVDLHIHSSNDRGDLSPVDIVREAQEQGLRAVAIVDQGRKTAFLAFNEALLAASDSQLRIIPGIEIISVDTSCGKKQRHILVYFPIVSLFHKLRELIVQSIPARNSDTRAVIKWAHSFGGVTISAHPGILDGHNERARKETVFALFRDGLDGLEVDHSLFRSRKTEKLLGYINDWNIENPENSKIFTIGSDYRAKNYKDHPRALGIGWKNRIGHPNARHWSYEEIIIPLEVKAKINAGVMAKINDRELITEVFLPEYGARVLLSKDEVLKYFGKQAQKVAAEERTFYLRRLDPDKDIYFLNEWQEEVRFDIEWRENWERRKGSFPERIPFTHNLAGHVIGLFSSLDGVENLEGFFGTNIEIAYGDDDEILHSYLDLAQVELRYRNIGISAELHNVADLLFDFVVKCLIEQASLWLDMRIWPNTPGSTFMAKRFGFKSFRGNDWELDKKSVNERYVNNNLASLFNCYQIASSPTSSSPVENDGIAQIRHAVAVTFIASARKIIEQLIVCVAKQEFGETEKDQVIQYGNELMQLIDSIGRDCKFDMDFVRAIRDVLGNCAELFKKAKLFKLNKGTLEEQTRVFSDNLERLNKLVEKGLLGQIREYWQPGIILSVSLDDRSLSVAEKAGGIKADEILAEREVMLPGGQTLELNYLGPHVLISAGKEAVIKITRVNKEFFVVIDKASHELLEEFKEFTFNELSIKISRKENSIFIENACLDQPIRLNYFVDSNGFGGYKSIPIQKEEFPNLCGRNVRFTYLSCGEEIKTVTGILDRFVWTDRNAFDPAGIVVDLTIDGKRWHFWAELRSSYKKPLKIEVEVGSDDNPVLSRRKEILVDPGQSRLKAALEITELNSKGKLGQDQLDDPDILRKLLDNVRLLSSESVPHEAILNLRKLVDELWESLRGAHSWFDDDEAEASARMVYQFNRLLSLPIERYILDSEGFRVDACALAEDLKSENLLVRIRAAALAGYAMAFPQVLDIAFVDNLIPLLDHENKIVQLVAARSIQRVLIVLDNGSYELRYRKTANQVKQVLAKKLTPEEEASIKAFRDFSARILEQSIEKAKNLEGRIVPWQQPANLYGVGDQVDKLIAVVQAQRMNVLASCKGLLLQEIPPQAEDRMAGISRNGDMLL